MWRVYKEMGLSKIEAGLLDAFENEYVFFDANEEGCYLRRRALAGLKRVHQHLLAENLWLQQQLQAEREYWVKALELKEPYGRLGR